MAKHLSLFPVFIFLILNARPAAAQSPQVSATDGTRSNHVYVEWSEYEGGDKYRIFRREKGKRAAADTDLLGGERDGYFWKDREALPGVVYIYTVYKVGAEGAKSSDSGYVAADSPIAATPYYPVNGMMAEDTARFAWTPTAAATAYRFVMVDAAGHTWDERAGLTGEILLDTLLSGNMLRVPVPPYGERMAAWSVQALDSTGAGIYSEAQLVSLNPAEDPPFAGFSTPALQVGDAKIRFKKRRRKSKSVLSFTLRNNKDRVQDAAQVVVLYSKDDKFDTSDVKVAGQHFNPIPPKGTKTWAMPLGDVADGYLIILPLKDGEPLEKGMQVLRVGE